MKAGFSTGKWVIIHENVTHTFSLSGSPQKATGLRMVTFLPLLSYKNLAGHSKGKREHAAL